MYYSVHGSSDPRESVPQTASRSVQHFAQLTRVLDTHRHADGETDLHTTLRATSLALGEALYDILAFQQLLSRATTVSC